MPVLAELHGGDSAAPTVSQVRRTPDWPTLALFVGCLGFWSFGLVVAGMLPVVGFSMVVLSLVLHSSLSHEILHGAPFKSQTACTALGMVQPGLAVPYLRFKRLHLAHHMDANLTDPYDDPETNYLDPDVWGRLPNWTKAALRFNNTLIGRMMIGPFVGQWAFMRADWQSIRGGDRQVLSDWVLHLPFAVLVLAVVVVSPMSVWSYLLAAYWAFSVLKIRTFLEHQAHAHSSGRTAIVEDRGPLAFLFLNNNFHVVHHMHPTVSWYRLPALYRAHNERYRARSQGYVYASYGAVFRQYLWRSKDPVPHPMWQASNDEAAQPR